MSFPIRHRWRYAALMLLMLIVCPGVQSATPLPQPTVDARSFILIDHTTGKVLAERNADERVDPASITKIMTVYAAGHALQAGLISMTDQVLVSEKAWKMEGSRMFIEVGKRVSVDALLDGIIIQSGNDASVALAEHISGTEEVFASVMNQHAADLGMTNSGFANATGLPDPLTFVTARDIATLSSALIREFPELYARFARLEYTWNGIRQPNRNRLLSRDPSVDGIKTGHTEAAGYCLAASAVREDTRLIAAVMGTDSDRARTQASHTLLSYGFRSYETKQIFAADAIVTTARVWRGDRETVDVGPGIPVHVTIPRGSYDKIEAVAELNEPLMAPLVAGQIVGHAALRLDGELISSVPLSARQPVPEGSIFSRLYDDLMLLFE